jgi:hypothetical protein
MNIFKEEPEDISMSFVVTKTYRVSTYGKTKEDCQIMMENMKPSDIKDEDLMDMEYDGGEVF